MKTTSNLLVLLALTASAAAQTNSEPRTPRPLVLQSSEKLPAPPVETGPAPMREAAPAASSPLAKPLGEPDHAPRIAQPVDRLQYTTQQDGTTWVVGQGYKASFGSGGATYVPFFGSQAPRNYPIDMSLVAATSGGSSIPLAPATAAVRDGDRIVIDRGPIDEVYELSLGSVEQTFVVSERPASGDLTLTVRLQSDLARATAADGFTFSNEFGSVHYGQAFVREADGTRLPVRAELRDDGVQIQVDAATMSRATFPLVVDPVISTFAVDNAGYDSVESDVSYDVSTNRHLIVYERIFSASDGDVYAILREGDGSNSYFAYLDNTSEDWRSPQCANLNQSDQFLMVAQARFILGAQNWHIWGMTVDAHTMVAGWKTLISTNDQSGDKVLGDVGGDSYDGPGASYYCVVWRRDYAAGDTDIHARLVTAQTTLVGPGTILIDNSGATLDEWASVSKSNGILGGGAAWTIAWHRVHTGTETDIYAARIAWDGTILNGSTPINTAAGRDYYPRASSPLDDGRVMLVYAHLNSSEHDLWYSLLSGTSVEQTGNMTFAEQSGFTPQNQIEYSIDADGQRFVVAYCESYASSTFDYDVWISAMAPLNNWLVVTESHVSMDFSGAQSFRTDIVASRSGGDLSSRRFFVTWDNTYTGTNHDILGGIYERPLGGTYQPFCPGENGLVACPCGNTGTGIRGCANSVNPNGALLSASGNAQTGSGDTLQFTVDGVPPNVTCTLFQGTIGAETLVPFGDGLRCVVGSLVRIRTKSANATGIAQWPTGGEPDVSVAGQLPLAGGLRFYQVSYRNSANFCTPATFNISNGMRVVWMP